MDGNLNDEVLIIGTVNASKLGDYSITYTVRDKSGNTTTIIRYVHVGDFTAPVLSLIGADTIKIQIFTPYFEPGIIISDNYDKTGLAVQSKSNLDTAQLGIYKINYCATDSSGNGPDCVQRIVIVMDTIAPKVNLLGNNPQKVEVFTVYKDPGVTVLENTTYQVETSGWNKNTNTLGKFSLTYTVTDASNNKVSVIREVEVIDSESPLLRLKGNSVVYLERWDPYVDEGYEVIDNYWDTTEIIITKSGDFVNTQSEGIYTLEYVATDGSGNQSKSAERLIVITEKVENGILQIDNNDYSIYPNPTSGLLTLHWNSEIPESLKIKVIDATGKELITSSVTLGQFQTQIIDLNDVQSGVYFIEIKNAQAISVKMINVLR